MQIAAEASLKLEKTGDVLARLSADRAVAHRSLRARREMVTGWPVNHVNFPA